MSGTETPVSSIKKPKKTRQPTVLVDSREATSASKIAKGLEEHGAKVKTCPLPKGDYVLSEQCAVERKTVQDFAYTLTRRNLFQQLSGLKELYPTAIVLLEGYMPVIYRFTRVNPSAIWGAMFALARQGIALVHTANYKESIDFLYTAAKQEQTTEKKIPVVHAVKKTETLTDAQVFLIASLPNIGRERALAILRSYETPLNALANIDGWAKTVYGLGPLISRKAKRILNAPFKE